MRFEEAIKEAEKGKKIGNGIIYIWIDKAGNWNIGDGAERTTIDSFRMNSKDWCVVEDDWKLSEHRGFKAEPDGTMCGSFELKDVIKCRDKILEDLDNHSIDKYYTYKTIAKNIVRKRFGDV